MNYVIFIYFLGRLGGVSLYVANVIFLQCLLHVPLYPHKPLKKKNFIVEVGSYEQEAKRGMYTEKGKADCSREKRQRKLRKIYAW